MRRLIGAEVLDQTGAREAVAVFKNAESLETAIDALLTSGFDRADICLLASEDAVVSELGHKYRKVSELEDDRDVPRECYVAREDLGAAEGGLIGGFTYMGACAATGVILASGGTLVPAIVGATLLGGVGAAIGSALARIVGHHYSEHLQEQIAHGGLLLWVRTHDLKHEQRAVDILKEHSGADVHVHGVPHGALCPGIERRPGSRGTAMEKQRCALLPRCHHRSTSLRRRAGSLSRQAMPLAGRWAARGGTAGDH